MSETTNRSAEISAALLPAYQRASQLKINKTEAKQLQKPFADKSVEIIPATGGLYIPHIAISNRLNQTFGPGAWALICRDHRADEDGERIRAEHILVVRGCVVGESVEEMHINPLESARYGDALKFTEGKALRRICATRLSCGSQIYEKDYCERWIEKYAESVALETGGTVWKKKGSKLALDSFNEMPVSPVQRPKADENLRYVMLQCLSTQGNENVLAFAIAEGILKPGQVLDEWPLDQVSVGESEIRKLQIRIQKAFEKPAAEADWKETTVPFGGMKDQKLGGLKPDEIAGYWEVAEDEKSPIGKKYPKFKSALDAAAKFFNFQKLKKAK